MCRVSIIIPIFNSGLYIERCLRSVCNQTISSQLEIIVVDDGSTDNSLEVVRSVLVEYGSNISSNIISLPQNGGVANARRIAVGAATGEFIMSCDSDDWMDSTMCEKLLAKADKDGSDMVVCDYVTVRGESYDIIGPCFKDNYIRELIRCNVTGSMCNKLIRTSLFNRNDFIFPDYDFSEDYVYCLQAAIYSHRISYVPEPLYYYYLHSDSFVRSSSPEIARKRYLDDMANFALDMQVLKNNDLCSQYRDEIIVHKLKMKNTYKNELSLWKQTFPELNREVFHSRYISIRMIISYYFSYIKSIFRDLTGR